MRIKTEASHGKDFTYRYSTHIPVINTIIEILTPELIVELGVGLFSTPVLLNSKAQKTIHVENDNDWLNYITRTYEKQLNQKNELLLHTLDNYVTVGLNEKELKEKTRQDIIQYYLNLSEKLKKMNYKKSVLMVDGYTCTRKISLDVLTNNFDVAIYHDAEDKIYNYSNIDKKLFENYDNYVLETLRTHTGLFIKKKIIDEKDLRYVLNKHILSYVNNLNITSEGFNLVKT